MTLVINYKNYQYFIENYKNYKNYGEIVWMYNGKLPSFFDEFILLKKFTSINNRIESLYPLRNCFDLEYLSIPNNHIHSLSEITTLTKLTYLNIYNNHVKNIQFLSHFPLLKEFICGKNPLETLHGIELCQSLEYLDCSDSNINTLSNLDNPKLGTIYCCNNPIDSLYGIENCPSLKYINCTNCKISFLNIQKRMDCLEKIYCDHNLLENLKSIHYVPNLKFLSARNNKIKTLKWSIPIKELTKVEKDIYHKLREDNNSNICIENMGDISICKKLEVVYLDNNEIDSILPLSYCSKLFYLRLGSNKLTNLHGIQDLPLTCLNISHNKINSLSKIQNITSLMMLHVSHNKINTLKYIYKLKHLSELDVSHNEIISF